MAERRLHGLQRVLGVNALSSTAYGNVGSSIYYARGLVAALAAGLTPLVFLLTIARRMRAHAIVMPLPPRNGTTVFGKTVETVLAERPCRVIIESEPANA